MIDIIIKRDNHKRHIVCPRCGSELAYAEEDKRKREVEPYIFVNLDSIECPNCYEIIKVE